MTKFIKCTVKATGAVYYAEVKTSWGKRYFSVDMGKTWHPSAKAARLHSESLGHTVEA